MTHYGSLICVHRVTSPIEANLVKGLLENEGIPVEITGEGLVGAYSGLPKVCEVRVLVPRTHRSAAEAIIRSYESRSEEPPGDPWICGDCGEANEPQFEICWRCGHSRSEA